MGKRFLIIDNRGQRAQRLMKEQWEGFLSQSNVDIIDCVPEESMLFSYDVIGIHGSLIKTGQYDSLLSNLLTTKYVIVFTGDVSQIVLLNEGHLLKIPATVFYSPKLIPFCQYLDNIQESKVQLLTLLYGADHWRLPVLFQLRQLLWQWPEAERNFTKKQKIEELKNTLSISDYSSLDEEINIELQGL